jgi:hypothetical protein
MEKLAVVRCTEAAAASDKSGWRDRTIIYHGGTLVSLLHGSWYDTRTFSCSQSGGGWGLEGGVH